MAKRKTTTRKTTTRTTTTRKTAKTAAERPRKRVHGGQELLRARAVCLAFPEATEKIAWGHPTFRVRDKIFAMYSDGHHGEGRVSIVCPAPPGAQAVYVGSEPHRYYVPPYVGGKGWIGIDLATVGDARLREHVREAYCRIAPARLRKGLEGAG